MNRKAVIIDARGEQALAQKTSDDTLCFRSLLQSPLGGNWREEDIELLHARTALEVYQGVSKAKGADFTCLLYLGVGSYGRMGRPWSEVEITLPSGEKLTERELNTGSARCLLIFDFTDAHEPVNEWQPELGSRVMPEEAENAYIRCLGDAEAGLVRVIGRTDPTKAASGSSFVARLIEVACQWRSAGRGPLSCDVAIARATELTKSRNLTIDYLAGRRMRHFPFLVSQ